MMKTVILKTDEKDNKRKQAAIRTQNKNSMQDIQSKSNKPNKYIDLRENVLKAVENRWVFSLDSKDDSTVSSLNSAGNVFHIWAG